MKGNKFGAKKIEIDGIKFDSQREGYHYQKLKMLMKAKEDRDRVIKIERQFPFELIINGKKIFKYKCDFRVTFGDGRIEYHDPKNPYKKGSAYQLFNIKKKAIEAQYNVTIKLI